MSSDKINDFVQISTNSNMAENTYSVTATFENDALMKFVFMKAIESAADKIADKFIAERGQEILSAIDPQAIANLAIDNSGAAIATELKKEAATRTRIVEHVKKEVWQRGFFGGMTRK